MLLRVGNKIFNTERIIIAEMQDSEKTPRLYIRLGGGGHKDYTYTSETFSGEAARKLWAVLQRESEFVADKVDGEGPEDDPPVSTSFSVFG